MRHTLPEKNFVSEPHPNDHLVSGAGDQNETRPIVHLVDGEYPFMSRAQAKDIMRPFCRAESVELDFSGTKEIWPGFADELLRVWPLSHSATQLTIVNANEKVLFMVRRVLGRDDLPHPLKRVRIHARPPQNADNGAMKPLSP